VSEAAVAAADRTVNEIDGDFAAAFAA
jgi:hypothetical protein